MPKNFRTIAYNYSIPISGGASPSYQYMPVDFIVKSIRLEPSDGNPYCDFLIRVQSFGTAVSECGLKYVGVKPGVSIPISKTFGEFLPNVAAVPGVAGHQAVSILLGPNQSAVVYGHYRLPPV